MLLETIVSVLEPSLNLLETDLANLRHQLVDQIDPKGKRCIEYEGDTDLVFIKTPSIYNTG